MKTIPLHSLVIMVGPSGAGKSTYASANFPAHEIVSLDNIREFLVGDSERQDVFWQVHKELTHRIHLKLSNGERVVVDGTHLAKKDRTYIAEIAKTYGVPVFFLIVNRPLAEKLQTRGRRPVELVENHEERFISSEKEILKGDYIATIVDTRTTSINVINKLPKGDIRDEVERRGYDGIMAISDVHGMKESLKSAMEWAAARNLFMVFLGDIVDYGPNSVECAQIVYDLVIRGKAISILGNHERKIHRWIEQSRKNSVSIRLSEGNLVTTKTIEAMSHMDRRKTEHQLVSLFQLSRHHVLFDNFVMAHAAVNPSFITKDSTRLYGDDEKLAIFGQVDPETPFVDNYPNRIYEWTGHIPSGYTAIVGHDVRSTEIPLEVKNEINGSTVFLDTGSGKGGKLSTAHIKKQNGKYKIVAYSGH